MHLILNTQIRVTPIPLCVKLVKIIKILKCQVTHHRVCRSLIIEYYLNTFTYSLRYNMVNAPMKAV